MFGYSNGNAGYELANEHQLSEILANFSSDYIYDVIDNHISKRYEFAVIAKPNMVNVFRSNFDNIRANYPMDIKNTNAIEQDVYNNIIDIICNKCNISHVSDTDDNKYLLATTLYDFLVCGFNAHMTNFLINLIVTEQNSIYSALELENLKKSKDSSTIYNKKVMDNSKLAVINANLPTVVQYISTLDITMADILSNQYQLPIVELITSNFSEEVSIFSDFMKTIISNPQLFPEYITELRLRIQNIRGDYK